MSRPSTLGCPLGLSPIIGRVGQINYLGRWLSHRPWPTVPLFSDVYVLQVIVDVFLAESEAGKDTWGVLLTDIHYTEAGGIGLRADLKSEEIGFGLPLLLDIYLCKSGRTIAA